MRTTTRRATTRLTLTFTLAGLSACANDDGETGPTPQETTAPGEAAQTRAPADRTTEAATTEATTTEDATSDGTGTEAGTTPTSPGPRPSRARSLPAPVAPAAPRTTTSCCLTVAGSARSRHRRTTSST